MPEGRPEAAQLYRSLAAPVLGYLRTQRVADAEDVLGEVFLQVARDLRRFRDQCDEGALRRWVFSIAHNRAMDSHRRGARHRAAVEQAEAAERSAVRAPEPLDPELVAALDALSPDQREVVVLRFVADLPLEAVADITNRKVGAVKALQHRALENLRRRVNPEAVGDREEKKISEGRIL